MSMGFVSLTSLTLAPHCRRHILCHWPEGEPSYLLRLVVRNRNHKDRLDRFGGMHRLGIDGNLTLALIIRFGIVLNTVHCETALNVEFELTGGNYPWLIRFGSNVLIFPLVISGFHDKGDTGIVSSIGLIARSRQQIPKLLEGQWWWRARMTAEVDIKSEQPKIDMNVATERRSFEMEGRRNIDFDVVCPE